jgi:hypothetical protein
MIIATTPAVGAAALMSLDQQMSSAQQYVGGASVALHMYDMR